MQRIQRSVEQYSSSRSSALAWGADLATVAVSMDFVALGIWVHTPLLFPFFKRFDSPGISREIPVWLIVIGCHAVLLIGSLILKNKHAEVVAGREGLEAPSFASRLWFSRNGVMFAANATGTLSLLFAIVVFTNAL